MALNVSKILPITRYLNIGSFWNSGYTRIMITTELPMIAITVTKVETA